MKEIDGVGIDFDDKPQPLATVAFETALGEMTAHFGVDEKTGRTVHWFGWLSTEQDGEPIRLRLEAVGEEVLGRTAYRPSGYVDLQWGRSKLLGPYAWAWIGLHDGQVNVVTHGSSRIRSQWEKRFGDVLKRLSVPDASFLDRAALALVEARVKGWQAIADGKRATAAELLAQADTIEAEELASSPPSP